MPNDEITQIRKIRHEISEECGHDVRKVAAYYRRVEDELKKSGDFRFEDQTLDLQTTSAKSDAQSAE